MFWFSTQSLAFSKGAEKLLRGTCLLHLPSAAIMFQPPSLQTLAADGRFHYRRASRLFRSQDGGRATWDRQRCRQLGGIFPPKVTSGKLGIIFRTQSIGAFSDGTIVAFNGGGGGDFVVSGVSLLFFFCRATSGLQEELPNTIRQFSCYQDLSVTTMSPYYVWYTPSVPTMMDLFISAL